MKVNLTILTVVIFGFLNPIRSGIIHSNGQPVKKIMAPNMNFQNPLIPAQMNGMTMNSNPFGMPMTGYSGIAKPQMQNIQQPVRISQMKERSQFFRYSYLFF